MRDCLRFATGLTNLNNALKTPEKMSKGEIHETFNRAFAPLLRSYLCKNYS